MQILILADVALWIVMLEIIAICCAATGVIILVISVILAVRDFLRLSFLSLSIAGILWLFADEIGVVLALIFPLIQ